MNKLPISNCKKNLFGLLGLVLAFTFAAPVCQADVSRSSVKVGVTTTDRSWYVSGSSTLHSFIVCDKGTDPDYGAIVPCDSRFNGENYYSTDNMKDANNTADPSKNFTIDASASASGSSMKSVRIEYMNGGVNPPSSWSGAQYKTCSGSSCTICHEGGSCANKVIPFAMLNSKDGGKQNVFWFRVIFTDSDNKSITTGFDTANKTSPYLDKFYRFVICGSQCKGGKDYTPDDDPDPNPEPGPEPDPCIPNNTNPIASTIDAQNIYGSLCRHFTYRLWWRFTDDDDANAPGKAQRIYQLNLREIKRDNKGKQITAGVPIFSATKTTSSYTEILYDTYLENMTATVDDKPSNAKLTIEYGKEYEWRVRVTDDDTRNFDGKSCTRTSDWSAWTGITGEDNIKPPKYHYPEVSFKVNDEDGENCLKASACEAMQTLSFASNSVLYSPTNYYQWYINGTAVGDAEGGKTAGFSKKILLANAKDFRVLLKIKDSEGTECSYGEKTITFDTPSVVWNEITPK